MPKKQTIELLIAEADEALAYYKRNHQGLSWREKILALVKVSGSIKKLGIDSNPEASKVNARERIRLYFTEHVMQVINTSELEVVSGISEYARRIRELRVQDGYKILAGNIEDVEIGIDLDSSEYLLLDAEPDKQAARRWHIANRIRREKGGSKKRILNFLLQNVGEPINSVELRYVAKASEFGRRVRELRTEEGYAISTRFTGRPDLKMGEYVLETEKRIAEPHDRKVPFKVEKQVYERAEDSCELCGWNRSGWSKRDPRILELHHIREHAKGGKNIVSNLIVLCSRCHDDIHAEKKELPPDIFG